MSFQVIYPPQLQVLSEPQGNDFIIGYSPAINKMVRVSISALFSGKSVPLWDPETNYPIDFIVEYGLRFWKSKQNDNLNHIPGENAWWTEASGETSTPIETIETTGANINLDFQNRSELLFKGSDDIDGARTWFFLNATNARKIEGIFVLNGSYPMTLPGTVELFQTSGSWDNGTKIWQPNDPGKFKLKGMFDGTAWTLEIFGPY
jgi:hypothetical protein